METQKLSFKDRYNQKIKEYLEAEELIELASLQLLVVCALNKKNSINEGHRSNEMESPKSSKSSCAFKINLFLFKLTIERHSI
jgi:hypothetical protein